MLASEMLVRLREAVGSENDTHVTDPELYRALTYGVADTWDTMLSMGIGTEGVKSVTFNSVAGQREYPMATLAPDFYQVSRLVPTGSAPVSRVNPSNHHLFSAPGTTEVTLYYFPKSPSFVDGTEEFDGVNGWEEHAIMTAAVYVKAKKEDDTGQFRARKREIEARMSVMANRLRDEPPRVVRRRHPYRHGWGIPYAPAVRGYDLRGGNLELFG